MNCAISVVIIGWDGYFFHDEIVARGYEFVSAVIDGKHTEWFKVSYDDPFYTELCEKGLNAFKCGKNRKNYGCFVLDK